MRRVFAVFVLLVAAGVGLSSPGDASETATRVVDVVVERPEGTIGIGDVRIVGSRVEVTVIDTRSDDPGWTVNATISNSGRSGTTWEAEVIGSTDPFRDGAGTTYAQTVVAGPRAERNGAASSFTWAEAPAGKGLGIARLGARLLPASAARETSVTVTVV